jgi:hypothetical protein
VAIRLAAAVCCCCSMADAGGGRGEAEEKGWPRWVGLLREAGSVHVWIPDGDGHDESLLMGRAVPQIPQWADPS